MPALINSFKLNSSFLHHMRIFFRGFILRNRSKTDIFRFFKTIDFEIHSQFHYNSKIRAEKIRRLFGIFRLDFPVLEILPTWGSFLLLGNYNVVLL